MNPLLAAAVFLFVAQPDSPAPEPADPPSLLLVDDRAQATGSLAWTPKEGDPIRLEFTAAYAGDAGRAPIGPNIEAYIAVGGTRLTKGAGHPAGAVVRLGFYKEDKNAPFFRDITRDTVVEVTLAGVRFNQPVAVDPRSIVQHIKYDGGDIESCGMPGDAREQFNLADPRETLNDRVRPGIDARPDALTGAGNPEEWGDALGSADLRVEPDGSVSMTVRFRYPTLRNLRDPWQSDLPGTFLEPVHFHLEFEALPADARPLDPARARKAPASGED
jgi:hypothetical protein